MWNTEIPSNRLPKICKVRVDMGINGTQIVHFEAWYNSAGSGEWVDWCGDTDSSNNWEVIAWMEIPS